MKSCLSLEICLSVGEELGWLKMNTGEMSRDLGEKTKDKLLNPKERIDQKVVSIGIYLWNLLKHSKVVDSLKRANVEVTNMSSKTKNQDLKVKNIVLMKRISNLLKLKIPSQRTLNTSSQPHKT